MIGSIREYFTLSDARAIAKLVPEDTRVALHDKLALGRQRSEAADALWSNGHVAEGLRLAKQAFDATLEAIAPFEGALDSALGRRAREQLEAAETVIAPASDDEPAEPEQTESQRKEGSTDDAESGSDAAVAESVAVRSDRKDEPDWATVLRRRGLSESKLREVLEAERALRGRTLPQLDREVTAADGDLFQVLMTARRHIERVLAPATKTPSQLNWTRASRIGFAGLFATLALVGLYLALKPPTGVQVTASGYHGPEFTPDKVIDGNEATEWLLPDRQTGELELRFYPPEPITTLRIKNSHNRHYNDRATREYTVEVYSKGELAHTLDAEFPILTPRPEWVEHDIGVEEVERVVIRVRSWHRLGAGLAEIQWN